MRVEIEYADTVDESKQGTIKIVNSEDEEQVICEKPTSKTDKNKIQIEQNQW